MLTFPLLPLVSFVALALSGAAGTVIQTRNCTPPAAGPLVVVNTEGNPIKHFLGSATAGDPFFSDGYDTAAGRFSFHACDDGAPFYITCVSCGFPNDVVGVYSTGTDANGEPDNWIIYDFGNSVSGTIPHRRGTTFEAITWTWNGRVVQPNTVNTDRTLQPHTAMIPYPDSKNGVYMFSSKAEDAADTYVLQFGL